MSWSKNAKGGVSASSARPVSAGDAAEKRSAFGRGERERHDGAHPAQRKAEGEVEGWAV